MKNSLMKEFADYKQSLLSDYGVEETLIPDNQIKELTPKQWQKILTHMKKKVKEGKAYDMDVCPYCIIHPNSCRFCPMAKAGNSCNDLGSSYNIVIEQLGYISEEMKGIVENTDNIEDKLLEFLEQNISRRVK